MMYSIIAVADRFNEVGGIKIVLCVILWLAMMTASALLVKKGMGKQESESEKSNNSIASLYVAFIASAAAIVLLTFK
jgi:hypothetical protein